MRVCMRTIDILSPVALGPSEAKPLAPRLPTLRGKVLGIRIDRAWRSFHVYADELGRLARERLGVADVVDLVETQGWGDGFHVIPPTEERVQAMLEATPLPPSHVVGVVEPRRGEATVEKIAVNAVLAGCKPEYFPAVLAAVEAVCEPRFNLYALNTTTCCATPALMLNGPARQRLGIECGYSCLGQSGRANATIGRALRLVMRNVGGAIPGAVSKSVF